MNQDEFEAMETGNSGKWWYKAREELLERELSVLSKNNPSLKIAPSAAPRMRFETGPAIEIIAKFLERSFPTLNGFTGTGLPHPNPATKSIMLPNGSRCFIGFIVNRPSNLAVSSPNLYARMAWLNS